LKAWSKYVKGRYRTIAAEARTQLDETLPAFVRGFLPSSARPAVDLIEHLPATVAVDQRPLRGGARSTVGTITDIDMDAFLDPSRSLNDGALLAPPFKIGSRDWHLLAASGRLDPDKRVSEYTDEERDILLYSTSGTVHVQVQGQQINATFEGAVVKVVPAGPRQPDQRLQHRGTVGHGG
jgi:hypothetical protein